MGRWLRLLGARVGTWLEASLWQVYASLYDGLLEVYAYQDMIDDVTRAADPAGLVVVDAGAGTGNVGAAMLAAGARQVVLVDSRTNMLARARRKLAPDVRAGRVRIVQDDVVAALSAIPDAGVDRVSAVNCLYALSERPAFFAQVARVLAPGGLLVVSHTTRSGSGPIVRQQVARGGLRAVMRPRLIGIALVDAVIQVIGWRGRYDFGSVETLAAEAAAGGLTRTRFLGRTYGGPQDGINVLLTFSRDVPLVDLPEDR